MPQASNFTIKNGASTPVDVTFTNLQPAGGNLPAVYQARSAGPNSAAQPKIAVSASGSTKTREVRQTIRTPYYVTGADGLIKVVDNCFTEVRTVIPDTCPATTRNDHAAFVANSLTVPQIRESQQDGYAPS